MTSKQLDLDTYKDNGEKIVNLLENLVEEQKLTNALIRRQLSMNKRLPRQIMKDMLVSELLKGRVINTSRAMIILKVSKPTAIKYMQEVGLDVRFRVKDFKGKTGLLLTKKNLV